MNRGYVHLWRKSLDAGWIKNHKLWAFWTYCLIKASYKEFDAIIGLQAVPLMPGQFIFGRKKASEETGLTEREIRTILAFLIKGGNLTIKSTNKFSVITIINWHTYQGNVLEIAQQNDQRVTNKGPHTNIKEYKNNIYSHEVLSYLNQKTGKQYRNTKHIQARLNEGRTVDECKRVINAKIADPYFIQNPKYLNPETLFRPGNFDRYLNESTSSSTNVKEDAKESTSISTCPCCGAQIPPQDRFGEGCIRCVTLEARA